MSERAQDLPVFHEIAEPMSVTVEHMTNILALSLKEGDFSLRRVDNMKPDCLGCQLANKISAVHVVYENDYVCCILDHNPFNEGHVLILPKEHVEDVDELREDTANAVIQASRLISKAVKALYKPDGITICQNGGIFSELHHFHMHVVPRYRHQSFADFYLETPLNNESEKGKLIKTRDELCALIKIIN